jgi:hypothetical protein
MKCGMKSGARGQEQRRRLVPAAALAAAVLARLRRRDQCKRQVKESTSVSLLSFGGLRGGLCERPSHFPPGNSGGDATDTRVDLPVAFGLGRIDAFATPPILFIPDSLT